MKFQVHVSAPTLFEEQYGYRKQQALQFAADAFQSVVLGNMGNEYGIDRPLVWPPLSPDYAKKVGRPYATLVLSGRLRGAIWQRVGTDAATVGISNAQVPYALVHQWGGGNNIPPRPYFPIDWDGNVLPETASRTVNAMRRAFE